MNPEDGMSAWQASQAVLSLSAVMSDNRTGLHPAAVARQWQGSGKVQER